MFHALPPLALPSQKSFVFDSCDHHVAAVLKQNGWKQALKQSNNFNLKWTWKCSNKEIDSLNKGQFINHFKGSQQITTKLGLSLLYKKNPVISDNGKSYIHYYPRSYNLNTQKQDFIRDFTNTSILNLLKRIIASMQLYDKISYDQAVVIKRLNSQTRTSQILHQIFQNSKLFSRQQHTQYKRLRMNGKLLIRLLFYLQNLFSLDQRFSFNQTQIKQLSQYSKQDFQQEKSSLKANEYQQQKNIIVPSVQLVSLLIRYHQKCLQQVNGYYEDGFSNIWVVKSNHSSRGRNIALIQDLKDIDSFDNGMKIVQKYIENIWVLHETPNDKFSYIGKIYKKKFDIRFWVFVKSFTPFVVYIYDQAYLRISTQTYRLDSLDDKNSHLTNFSINWKSKKQLKQNDDSSFILYSSFLEYLRQSQQVNTDKLTQKIHYIILQTLRLIDIKQDTRCFQLFGFDIILDAKLNPWILQCNMSPACYPRGQLKYIVKQMTKGIFTILGLVQGSSEGWKLVTTNKGYQLKSLSQSNYHILKQINSNSSRGSLMRSSIMNWNQFLLRSDKINQKNYMHMQKFHMKIEKSHQIQRFYKKRNKYKLLIKNCEKSARKSMGMSRFLKVIETLAKVLKRNKKIWFSHLNFFVKKCVKQ